MMARGFKPVGWVAGVAGAALCCYMLSLNVAAERAELARIEGQIVVAKQDIRSLQTELGTRGRLDQLEHWNAEVLALSAPTAAQFLENEVVLARFETKQPTIEERAKVQMASAETSRPEPALGGAEGPAPKIAPADYAAAAAVAAREPRSLVHRAAFVGAVIRPVPLHKASAKPIAADKKSEAPSKRAEAKKATPAKKADPALRLAETKKVAPVKKAVADAPLKQLARAGKTAAPAPAKKAEKAPAASTGMLADSLLRELGEAARSEKSAGSAGAR
jgi:hypothetical protein